MKHTPHIPETKLRRNPAADLQKINERKYEPEQLYLIGASQVGKLTPLGVPGADEFYKELTQRPIPKGTAFFTRDQLANFIVESAVACGWKNGGSPTLRDRRTWEARLDGIYPADLRTGQSYWTGFTFQERDDLHMTHKYLGDLTVFEAHSVRLILDGFFSAETLLDRDNRTPFDQETMFGPNNDIRVLVMAEGHERNFVRPDYPYSMLRKLLDNFRADDYASYRPHVIISDANIRSLNLRVKSYVLCNGDQVIAEWV